MVKSKTYLKMFKWSSSLKLKRCWQTRSRGGLGLIWIFLSPWNNVITLCHKMWQIWIRTFQTTGPVSHPCCFLPPPVEGGEWEVEQRGSLGKNVWNSFPVEQLSQWGGDKESWPSLKLSSRAWGRRSTDACFLCWNTESRTPAPEGDAAQTAASSTETLTWLQEETQHRLLLLLED